MIDDGEISVSSSRRNKTAPLIIRIQHTYRALICFLLWLVFRAAAAGDGETEGSGHSLLHHEETGAGTDCTNQEQA